MAEEAAEQQIEHQESQQTEEIQKSVEERMIEIEAAIERLEQTYADLIVLQQELEALETTEDAEHAAYEEKPAEALKEETKEEKSEVVPVEATVEEKTVIETPKTKRERKKVGLLW